MSRAWRARGARWAAVAAAVAGASGVVLGALGAHALPHEVSPRMLGVWHTAVHFQFWHALALAILAIAVWRTRAAAVSTILFAVGIVLFCGSLYMLVLGAPSWVGVATPLGGAALLAGWVAFGMALYRGVRIQTPRIQVTREEEVDGRHQDSTRV